MSKTIVRAVALVLAAVMLLGLLAGIVMADEYIYGRNRALYSSEEFEAEYTYDGDDLGAVWSPASTTFRIWAPTASYVALNLYDSGNPEVNQLKQYVKMTRDVNGTWETTVDGDLNGTYYTYQVNVEGMKNEVCDPYARAVGVNGRRAMVIDLDSTDPEGWENDTDPHYDDKITDAVIYELHVGDAGKFLGLTEKGESTGLDHIAQLGVTHLNLLPVFDFASVDETAQENQGSSPGYDPLNYNVPEGSYATDPYNGEVRVKEFKQMVKTLHDSGISVVMDVAYGHVFDAGEFCFNKAVPGYFSRFTEEGVCSDGSGYGNDTASERAMVKKYIVDSVTYWADEYHIDGFCFDSAGLLDTETINACIEAVHEHHPNVIFYGHGGSVTTDVTKEGYTMATRENAAETPEFAYISDFSCADDFSAIGDIFRGKSGPIQTVNDASAPDGEEEQNQMNRLAAAVAMTSQGAPFLRLDPADGPDYYAGLTAFRKAHPALRMTSAEEIGEKITQLSDLDDSVAGFHILAGANGEENEIVTVFNAGAQDTTVTLPEGVWAVYIDGEKAGTEPLRTVEDSVTVAAASACVLVSANAEEEPVEETQPEAGQGKQWLSWFAGLELDLPAVIAAAVAVVSFISIIVILILKRRK